MGQSSEENKRAGDRAFEGRDTQDASRNPDGGTERPMKAAERASISTPGNEQALGDDEPGREDAEGGDPLGDVEALRARDGFRFANVLRAWIEVEDGRAVAHGQEGGGLIGATTLRLGERDLTFQAVAYPDLRPHTRVSGTEVTFLAASALPGHWIYDHRGQLVAKSGLIDFESWYREGGEDETPWGGVDTPARVVAAQSVLERSLSVLIVDGSPRWRRLEPGEVLVILEGGRRSATLRAVTACRVGQIAPDRLDRDQLVELRRGRAEAAGG